MRPGDRLVCVFVRAVQVGMTFVGWPLHVTIVPWFRVALTTDELRDLCHQQLAGLGMVNAVVGPIEAFGHQKQANIVQPTAPFQGFGDSIRQVLHEHDAWFVDEGTKKRKTLTPHITVQKDDSIAAGASFQCDRLYIVEQKGGYKEIVTEVKLA